MLLKIKYENKSQEIELNEKDTEKLWISLSLNDESDAIDEKRIQEEFDNRFNNPDYNNYHKFNRHMVNKSSLFKDSEDLNCPDEMDLFEDKLSKNGYDTEDDKEKLCNKIRKLVRPAYAKIIIDVYVNGLKEIEIARRDGICKSAVSHKLDRAIKAFKKKCGSVEEFKKIL